MDSETLRPCRSRADDEAAADLARDALRAAGVVPIEPDPPLAVMLAPGERVLAVRHAARVELLARTADDAAANLGDLYLTDRRLVVVARPLDIPLEDIREVGVLDDQLLLLIERCGGVRIHVEDPRVLRVELASARAAARGTEDARTRGQPASR